MEWIIIWALSFATIALFFRGILPQGSEKAVDRLIKKQIENKRREKQIQTSIQSQKTFKRLGNFLEKHFGQDKNKDKSSYSETQKLLTEAGFREGYTIYLYGLSQIVGLIVGLLLGWIFTVFENLEGSLAFLPYIFGPAIGFYIPILYVRNRRNRRVSEIQHVFPDALEMLALCNEASMTVDAALPKLAQELEKKYPILSEEFFIISIELSLLDNRAKAFDGFYKRFPLDEVRSFVTTINQAERTGTPIAKSMRLLASEMRKDRIATIQAKLESLAGKLVLPLVIFFFVPMMIFMVYPIFNKVDLSGL